MAGPNEEECELCRFWEHSEPDGRPHMGECHRRAPGFDGRGGPAWVPTHRTDWCGEWEYRSPHKPGEVVFTAMDEWEKGPKPQGEQR